MRRMIVVGELPAGQWLRKRTMSARTPDGATPVVEAIRRLEHDGLVQTDPPWGPRVPIFTVPEIFELASMRVVLEGLVGRCAASRMTIEQIRHLREIAIRVDKVDNDLTESPLGALASEDINFHLKLADEAGLPRSAARNSSHCSS